MKNVLIFIGEDFVSHLFLNNFVQQSIQMDVKPILVFVRSKANAHTHKEISRYAFYEKDILHRAIYPFIEENKSNIFSMLSPQQIIEKYDLQTIQTYNVNDPELIAQIKNLDIMGAISVRCFQIFKLPIIEMIRKKGFFCNSHPGILPHYRGVYCLLRGLVNKEKKLGWTLHDIDTGIDTGRIIKEIPHYDYDQNQSMPVILGSTVPSLAQGWLEFIKAVIENNDIPRKPQTHKGAYYTYPTAEEFNYWYINNLLKPLIPKDMVKFYFDMFVKQESKIQQSAIDFKVKIITAVARYETLMEMHEEKSIVTQTDKQAA